jgi:hypothetical protein
MLCIVCVVVSLRSERPSDFPLLPLRDQVGGLEGLQGTEGLQPLAEPVLSTSYWYV